MSIILSRGALAIPHDWQVFIDAAAARVRIDIYDWELGYDLQVLNIRRGIVCGLLIAAGRY